MVGFNYQFNESILNKSNIVSFDNAKEYVAIESCKDYTHDLIKQIHALEFLLGFILIIAIFALWKTGRIQADYQKIKAWFNERKN